MYPSTTETSSSHCGRDKQTCLGSNQNKPLRLFGTQCAEILHWTLEPFFEQMYGVSANPRTRSSRSMLFFCSFFSLAKKSDCFDGTQCDFQNVKVQTRILFPRCTIANRMFG